MSKDRVFQVEAQEDFVEKLAIASPQQALAELIWNALDAEATPHKPFCAAPPASVCRVSIPLNPRSRGA